METGGGGAKEVVDAQAGPLDISTVRQYISC